MFLIRQLKFSQTTTGGSTVLSRLLWSILIGCLFSFLSSDLSAQTKKKTQLSKRVIDLNRANNVKALCLWRFSNYAEWPERSFLIRNGEFAIGVLGPDSLGTRLDQIAMIKKAQGRKISILRFKSFEDYKPCHILFIPEQTPAETQSKVIKKLALKPVLLVGETPGFAEKGGFINFYFQDGSVKFEINTDVAKQSPINIDARLLTIARKLDSGPKSQ